MGLLSVRALRSAPTAGTRTASPASSDRHQRICFALALWNGRDPILKERLFGLSGNQGNHGEDVKEQYFYLDNTPTHSYMKCLYKYPQAAFPYQALIDENRRRTRQDPEFELLDTGVFAENRYFDVFVEYAKARPDDILIRITVCNRGPETAPLHVLPTVWFRNRWSWGYHMERPLLRQTAPGSIELDEPYYGKRYFYARGECDLTLHGKRKRPSAPSGRRESTSRYTKSCIGHYVVRGERSAVNPRKARHQGFRALRRLDCARRVRRLRMPPHRRANGRPVRPGIRRRPSPTAHARPMNSTLPSSLRDLSEDARAVMRQAFAGLLWSKQYYHYVVRDWLKGDPDPSASACLAPLRPQPRVDSPLQRRRHLHAGQVGISVVRRLGPRLSTASPLALVDSDSPRTSSC